LIYAAVVAGLCLAVFVLYFFPPAETRFYPRCIFHAVTGLECPGCGSLRAAHSVLHGDFAMAFRLNPLLFILLPLAGLAWVSSPYLQERVLGVVQEIHKYQTEDAATSSGFRLEFWKKSIQFIAAAPVLGHGTGSVRELFRRAASEGDGASVSREG
jgi:O-antigen ligase